MNAAGQRYSLYIPQPLRFSASEKYARGSTQSTHRARAQHLSTHTPRMSTSKRRAFRGGQRELDLAMYHRLLGEDAATCSLSKATRLRLKRRVRWAEEGLLRDDDAALLGKVLEHFERRLGVLYRRWYAWELQRSLVPETPAGKPAESPPTVRQQVSLSSARNLFGSRRVSTVTKAEFRRAVGILPKTRRVRNCVRARC